MGDPKAIYEKLLRLSPDSAAEGGEAETARLAMERLKEKYGDGIVPANVMQAQRDIRYKTPLESAIIVHVGHYLGLEVYGLKGQRALKEIRIRGDQPLVEIALDLIAYHTKKLGALMDVFASDYLWRSMPYEAGEEAETIEGEEQIEAFLTDVGLGSKNQGVMTAPRLEGGRR